MRNPVFGILFAMIVLIIIGAVIADNLWYHISPDNFEYGRAVVWIAASISCYVLAWCCYWMLIDEFCTGGFRRYPPYAERRNRIILDEFENDIPDFWMMSQLDEESVENNDTVMKLEPTSSMDVEESLLSLEAVSIKSTWV